MNLRTKECDRSARTAFRAVILFAVLSVGPVAGAERDVFDASNHEPLPESERWEARAVGEPHSVARDVVDVEPLPEHGDGTEWWGPAMRGGHVPSDWDLYMLRLVNRARQDPAGEAARIGSAVVDNSPAQPPLAYQLNVGQAAQNHNEWMHENFGNLPSGFVPDSFTHYETLDGTQMGTPATGTPGYTGATLGPRLTNAGYSWSAAAENISAAWSTASLPVNQAQIDANHFGWWESSGHRQAMLSPNYTAFGHMAESRPFSPPQGGLPDPFDNLHYATQNYGRPLTSPLTYILGVLYMDNDGSGDWTPREASDPMREGVASAPFDVFISGTSTLVAAGTTMANGAFSVNIGNGQYDLEFDVAGQTVTVEGIVVSGANVNAGDILVTGGCMSTAACPEADVNCDNVVSGLDIAVISSSANFGRSVSEAQEPRADVNGDGVVSGLDVAAASNSACFGQ